jgi:hypothetical protein
MLSELGCRLVIHVHLWYGALGFRSFAPHLEDRGFGNARHAMIVVTMVLSSTGKKDVRQGPPREHAHQGEG